MSASPAQVDLLAIARVQVTVEVTLASPWPETATIVDVQKRAAEEATQAVQRVIRQGTGMRIMGEPRVQVVIVEAGK